MVETVIVQPNRAVQVVGLYRHKNPLINAAAIGIECLQPIDGRQIEAGIGKGHQFPVDQIPVIRLRNAAYDQDFEDLIPICLRNPKSAIANPKWVLVASNERLRLVSAGNPNICHFPKPA